MKHYYRPTSTVAVRHPRCVTHTSNGCYHSSGGYSGGGDSGDSASISTLACAAAAAAATTAVGASETQHAWHTCAHIRQHLSAYEKCVSYRIDQIGDRTNVYLCGTCYVLFVVTGLVAQKYPLVCGLCHCAREIAQYSLMKQYGEVLPRDIARCDDCLHHVARDLICIARSRTEQQQQHQQKKHAYTPFTTQTKTTSASSDSSFVHIEEL